MRKRTTGFFAILLILTMIFSQTGFTFAETGDDVQLIPADTDNRMFYLEEKDGKKEVLLKVADGKMEVTFALTGTGYDYLYMGSAKEAEAAEETAWSAYEAVDGKYTYTLEIPALDQELTVAAHAVKSGKWFEHTMIFYSSEEKKAELEEKKNAQEEPENSENGTKPSDSGKKPGKKPETESKKDTKADPKHENSDNPNSGAVRVDSSTSLKDGNYACENFRWSGGSGRLAYIRCNGISVKNGQAYAEIEFSSTGYDKVKASGQVYNRIGSGNSRFNIPVEMNANNTISGRTVAMSSPHWVTYTIYPYIKGAEKPASQKKDEKKKDGKTEPKDAEIIGLDYNEEVKVKHADLFRLYDYNDGIRMLEINLKKNSHIQYEKKKVDSEQIEYDEEGKPIAKSQSEITRELYQNNKVRYLLVPEDAEVPAGSDKETIIIRIPDSGIWTGAKTTCLFMEKLQADTSGVLQEENYCAPEYKSIISKKAGLAILPAAVTSGEKAKEQLETLETRFSTIGLPVIVDRSLDEETEEGKAEWIKVYAALLGMEMPKEKDIQEMFRETDWKDYISEPVLAEEAPDSTGPAEEKADTPQTEETPADESSKSWLAGLVILAAAAVAAGYGVSRKKKHTRKTDEKK